jgi:hypothetical protein
MRDLANRLDPRVRAALAAAYLAGAWQWAAFFSWGRDTFMLAFDWIRVGYYFAAVRDAIRDGVLPLYYAAGIDGEWVNFYWAHPDTPLLPHLLLLHWLRPTTFIALTALAFYSIGFAGVVALARRLRLSLVPTLLLLLLFLGNGYVLGHLRVGHVAWLSFFLLPWWCHYTWALADDEPLPHTSLALAGVLAVVLLDGGTHFALWCWLVLAVIAGFRPASVGAIVLRAACWFVLFTAVRLVPTFTVFPLEVVTHFAWMGGYHWASLWAAVSGGQSALAPYSIYAWEFDGYVGTPLVVFLLVFGLLVPFALPRRRRHLVLLAAIVPFAVAMSGDTLVYIRDRTGLPLLGGERVPTRMIIVPILVLAVQACWSLQRVLDRTTGRARQALATAALLLLCVGAFQMHKYAVLCRPYSSLPQTVPEPHLPMVPSGTGWGQLPIALVTSDPTEHYRGLTFAHIYVQAIEMGALVTAVGLILAAMTIARGDASAEVPPPD